MSVDKLLKKCWDYYYACELEKAIEVCDEVFKIEKDNQIAYSYKTKSLFYLKRFDDSLACLDEAISAHPNNYRYWNTKARILTKIYRLDEAIECFNQSFALLGFDRGNWREMFKIRGECYLKKAKETWYLENDNYTAKKYLKAYSNYSDIDDEFIFIGDDEPFLSDKLFYFENKALDLFYYGYLSESFESYRKALKIGYELNERWYTEFLSKAIDEFNGNYDEFFSKIFTITDENYELFISKVKFHADRQHKDDAIKIGEKLLEYDSTNKEIINLMANVYYKFKMNNKCIECYDKGLKIDSSDIDFLNGKLLFYIRLGKTKEAFDFYYALNDDVCLDSFILMVNDFLRFKKYDDAIDCYKKLLNKYPDDVDLIDAIERDVMEYNLDFN